MKKIGVILLSGGLDSTTAAALARQQGFELTAITAFYGQRHSKEIRAAEEVARVLSIRHLVIDVSFFKTIAWYSALTGTGHFAVPRRRDVDIIPEGIPATYVPLRNTFFITIAAAFLESEVLNLVETGGVHPDQIQASVFIAANAVDYSGYPDCRPEYFEQMSKAILLGSKLWTQYGRPMTIETPLIRKSKAEIVRMAMDLKAPLELTWSCYEGGDVPCGKCDSCILRAKGFAEAGIEDPLLVRLGRSCRKSPLQEGRRRVEG